MKQKTSGIIALFGIFALAGCYTYQGDAINNASYNEVQATPNFAVMKVGDSDQLLVRLINAASNGALTNYTLSTIPAGILVHQNLNYRPVYDPKLDTLVPTGDKTTQQYFIVGVTQGKYTFTLTPTSVNTGVSATVTVIVAPIDLGPAIGTTSGLHAGDTVTVTLPTGSVFARSGSKPSVPTFAVGPKPAVASFSADSTSMRILVAPGDSGALTVTNIGEVNEPAAAKLTLSSTNAIAAVPAITVAPTTLSTPTPAFGSSFTVTLGNNLRFTPATVVNLGTGTGVIVATSADSATATVVPYGTVTGGAVSFTGVVLSFLPTVPLTLPSDGKTVTIGAVTSGDPADLARATAPTITIPPSGGTTVISGSTAFGNGGQCAGGSPDGCALFKFTVADSTVMDLGMIWPGGADMGLYRLNSTGTSSAADGCDAGGQDAPGETCTMTIAPGTYFFAVDFFGVLGGYPAGPDTVPPAWFQIKIKTH